MAIDDIVIELHIGYLNPSEYGWTTCFRERPGDTLGTGTCEPSYQACIEAASSDLPDNTFVEIRARGICAGTWHTHQLQNSPATVAEELSGRLSGFVRA